MVLAEEAAAIGLVNRVLPPDELLPATYDYARALAHDVSPASLRETKRQIYGDLHGDVGSAVERSVALTDEMMGGADYAEGVRAWTERRTPDFPDPGDMATFRAMATRLYSVVIDAADPSALGRFWSEATGWPITLEETDEVVVEPPEGEPRHRARAP